MADNLSSVCIWFRRLNKALLTLTIVGLSGNMAAQATSNPRQRQKILSTKERQNFSRQMSSIKHGKGCFTAHYPVAKWKKVPCGPAPQFPNPVARGARPFYVGDGTDFFLNIASGNISTATGSFDNAGGITNVRGYQLGNTSTAYEDTYSLQLNAGIFTTSACGGAAGCSGWEQFLFSQSQCRPNACIFIEYWLLNHGSPCPGGGWNYYPGSSTTTPGCFINTAFASLPVQAVAQIGQIALTGSVSGGLDTVTVTTATGEVDAATQDSLLNLAQSWKGAEYNLVGDCCATEAFLNAGSSLTVRLAANNGSTNAPGCSTSFAGATAESNNLNITSSCAPTGGAAPAIVFTESGGGNLPPAVSYGDPHLTTFFGTHYDFQGSGEFLLVQSDPDFTLQARQRTWSPSTVAVNTGIGMKMGTQQVAVCLSGLEVSGTPRSLPDGQSLSLADGVSISRRGNTYIVSRPSGDVVQARLMGSYIDVNVTLGSTNTHDIKGLLGGNRGENDRTLRLRNGTPLKSPISWNDWVHYADSWRVQPKDSLLCHQGAVSPGMPSRQANADSDLRPEQREHARSACLKAGVPQGSPVLNDCILDVGLFGKDSAADVFVHAPPVRNTVVPGR